MEPTRFAPKPNPKGGLERVRPFDVHYPLQVWLKSPLKTRYVLLDTQVFVTNNFDVRSRVFERLRQLVHLDRANVLISDVSIKEVERRIRQHVEASKKWVNAQKSEARILMAVEGSLFESLKSAFTPDAISEKLIESFHGYLDVVNATIVPHTEASLAQILEDYFAVRPPFKEGEKRKEFPDAITLSSIGRWAERNGRVVYIISADRDMQAACEGKDYIHHLENLQHFFTLENVHHEDSSWILDSIDEKEEELQKALTDLYREASVYVSDVHGEVVESDIEAMDVWGYELISIDEKSAEFEISFRFTLTAEVSFPDPMMSYWDKEEDRLVVFETIKKNVKAPFEKSMTICVQVDRVGRELGDVELEPAESLEIQANDDGWPYK